MTQAEINEAILAACAGTPRMLTGHDWHAEHRALCAIAEDGDWNDERALDQMELAGCMTGYPT